MLGRRTLGVVGLAGLALALASCGPYTQYDMTTTTTTSTPSPLTDHVRLFGTNWLNGCGPDVPPTWNFYLENSSSSTIHVVSGLALPGDHPLAFVPIDLPPHSSSTAKVVADPTATVVPVGSVTIIADGQTFTVSQSDTKVGCPVQG